jgi:hypothetical protein
MREHTGGEVSRSTTVSSTEQAAATRFLRPMNACDIVVGHVPQMFGFSGLLAGAGLSLEQTSDLPPDTTELVGRPT